MNNMNQVPQWKPPKNKKRTNRRLVVFIFLFFVSLLILLFLNSPLNKVTDILITGTDLLADEQVLLQSRLQQDMPFLEIDEEQVKHWIEEHPVIKSANVTLDFPGTIRIAISEYKHVGYIVNQNQSFDYLLENGTQWKMKSASQAVIDKPIIHAFQDKSLLPLFTKELSQLDKGILSKISEIEHHPTDSDPYRLHLFMKEGFEVRTSIRKFSKRMTWYPTFVKNLEREQMEKGIFMLFEGKWFVPYSEYNKSEDEQDHVAKEGENENESP